ncbi:WXG100 family type VII secretion target [Kutzneria buriramensis]|uniref:Type VII secretion system (Wss) protein ESAT-6 n=1 Tax=Kutzneria buriramensis TaxID=1045776 RepID=A0A3E0GWD1_9PSEU|nr:hypothetical protein [Kutzneria buriramensis]REH30668.1 hypothetical protein BCF44_12326 [Kutzneria buriramensis]
MGQQLGADPDELRDLGGRMDSSADQVDHVTAGITALLSFSRWEGADGERFRSEWHGRLRGQLSAAAAAMRDCGSTLRDNAAQQTDASKAEDGGVALSLGLGIATVLGDVAGMSERASKDLVAKLPKWVRGLAFNPVADAKAAKVAFAGLGAGLNAVGMALDIGDAARTEPGSADSFNKWADVGFDGAATLASTAEVAAMAELIPGAQPIATAILAIDAVHLVYDDVVAVDPELPSEVVSAVGQAGKKAVDAAESVISGGAHAVLSWL